MRSRYSAYVLQNISYLKSTWHKSTCPDTLILDSNIRWIGLEIKNSEAGAETDQAGTVEFGRSISSTGGLIDYKKSVILLNRVLGGCIWKLATILTNF